VNKDLGLKDLREIKTAISETVTSVPSGEFKPTFHPVEYEVSESPDPSYPLQLLTANLLQHSGALSIMSKNLGSVSPDAYLQINPVDAKRYGIEDDGFVKVTSRRGEVIMKAMYSVEMPEGAVFAPVNYPYANVNQITHLSTNGETSIDAVKVEPVVI
ncbi:MAG: molybdopterin dinucleotide binding domain-containing protein, partial [Thermodesulfovibrionales bacterium]